MIRLKKTTLVCLGLSLSLVAGCSSSGRKTIQEQEEALAVPPGLDEQTVLKSNQIADKNFVSIQKEKEAQRLAQSGKQNLDKVDAFWKVLESRVQKTELSDDEQAAFDRELNRGAEALQRWKQLTDNGRDERALGIALGYSETAKTHLENAVRINPFDKNARALLAVAYYNLQSYFGQEKNYEKSIEVLERLVRLERGEHELYRLLGENYLALSDFERAAENFNLGKTVLIKTSFGGPPPPEKLFYYAYMLGDTYARMYSGEMARKMFKAAVQLAQNDREKADAGNYLKWIDWDGGNIAASEKWDEIIVLENTKEYKKVLRACERFLPDLHTPEAKLSVQQKMAVIEFEFLEKREQAVERMKSVFAAIAFEKLQAPNERMQSILNTYGAMLYRLGVEARNQDERKTALAYFSKAVTFRWNKMAKALMETVTLVWNSPQQAVQYGEKALELGEGVLTEEEKCELLSLMVKAMKSAGQFDKAREYFTNWKKCQEKT